MRYDISKYNPCRDALNFYNSCESTERAWETCQRGDWMLWIAQKIEVNFEKITLAKAICAYTVRHIMKDQRSKNAVYVAFLFGRGKATKNDLYAAAAAADAAYDAAKKENQKKTSDICRKILTDEVFRIIKEETK